CFHVPYISTDFKLPLIVYLLGLVVLAIGKRGFMLGGNSFLITSAPDYRRPSYIAFVNTVACPLIILPLLGAWMANIAGMWSVFVFAALGSLCCVLAAFNMLPNKPRLHSQIGASAQA